MRVSGWWFTYFVSMILIFRSFTLFYKYSSSENAISGGNVTAELEEHCDIANMSFEYHYQNCLFFLKNTGLTFNYFTCFSAAGKVKHAFITSRLDY